MAITTASNRFYLITANDNGNILDFGPASTESFIGTFLFQFQPDASFNGQIAVLARLTGPAAASAQIPFVPVPYRRITINNVASDYAFVSDLLTITNATKIQVPASRDAVGFLVACTAGTCIVVSQDIHGSAL